MKRIFFFISFFCLLCSCGSRYSRRQAADAALYTADSLYSLNEGMHPDTLLDDAIDYYQSCINIPEEKLARAYFYRGRIKATQDEVAIDDCMYDFLQAEMYSSNQTAPDIQGRIHGNLGFLYMENNEYDKALSQYYKSLIFFSKMENKVPYIYSLLDIAGAKSLAGDFDSLENVLDEALLLADDSPDLLGMIYQEKGVYYLKSGKLDSALTCFSTSLQYPGDGGNGIGLRNAYIAEVYYRKQIPDSVYKYANLALETTTDNTIHFNAYYMLMYYAQTHDNTDLLDEYAHKRADVQTLMLSTENKLHATEEKQKILKQEKRYNSNIRIIVWGSVLLLVLIIVFTSVLIGKIKKNKQNKEQELSNTIKTLEQKDKIVTKQIETHITKEIERSRQQVEYKIKQLCDMPDCRSYLQWRDWDKASEKINAELNNFIAALCYNYPDITEQDMRMCVCILLNLSIKNTAEWLYLSERSIGKIKQRTAAKLNKTVPELHLYFVDMIRNVK